MPEIIDNPDVHYCWGIQRTISPRCEDDRLSHHGEVIMEQNTTLIISDWNKDRIMTIETKQCSGGVRKYRREGPRKFHQPLSFGEKLVVSDYQNNRLPMALICFVQMRSIMQKRTL